MSSLPDIQLYLRPGIAEFGWGHPDAALLPAAAMARASALALGQRGTAVLAYGAEQGPGHLIELLCGHLGRREGLRPPAEQLMISGGTSQALDMLCGQLSRPGDVALVEAPTYHLALRIFRDRGLRLIAVPSDEQGLQVEAAAALLASLRASGEQVAFLYLVATFANPSGTSLSPERRLALATLAQREQLPVLEDDAYGELWYDEPPPAPIRNLLPDAPIVRLGTFAKTLAPGLRLGWLLADPALIGRCVGSGLLDSGGGVNHLAAQIAAAFLELGLLEPHLEFIRASLRARRDAMLAALARHMPAECSWSPPGGGFFVWVRLPAQIDAAALLPQAEAAGVSYLPGTRFFAQGGGEHQLRLSFSLLPLQQIDEGVRRLGEVLAAA